VRRRNAVVVATLVAGALIEVAQPSLGREAEAADRLVEVAVFAAALPDHHTDAELAAAPLSQVSGAP
jgi:hypothetical protein